MESKKDAKRKKDKHDEHENPRDRKYKRRSKSRSPARLREKDTRRKRRNSRSRSPEVPVKQEKVVSESNKDSDAKPVPARKARDTDMLNTRTGGAYIPPARLRMMQAQITDKSSVAYQRLAWEALKKSIHGHINKINVGNIGIIIKELLKENIVRGRGLLCRSVIQAQAASPTFTNVYAALVAAVNSRFPNIGELLLKRLVIQFKRGFKRNDKPICISSASFIAHLVNQRVAHEILALELLTLLVESPSDDSVEVAIAFLKECGQKLTEVSSKGVNAIFEMLRNILHEGQLDKRVQYMIEVMFQVWKDGFKDHPALIEELELVPEEDQFTHLLMLDDATDSQDILNVFKFDEKYEENEQKYKTLSKEILGSDAESGEEDGSGESGSEESEEEVAEGEQKGMTIIDNTETNLVALRRTIYLTINSSLDFEECAHKLMKMQLKPGQEVELCHMFLDCCAEQRTYEKFYGLLAQRFCNINRIYIGPFEEIFKDSYSTAHRLDTNRLRNVSKFFAHLLFTDSISWEVMECVKLNEEDTTSSSRIYIKILFQELAEYMGLKKLNDRLKDPTLQLAFSGVFPRDNPKNTRFSINFFTSIGLGGLTDELREHLKQMPKNVPAPVTEINVDSESDSSSSSSSSSEDSSSNSSSSGEEKKKKKKKKDKSREKSKTVEETEPQKDDTERWGHDGFYDTYGKDARRTENRPERNERDSDNFLKPRDVPQRRENDRGRYERDNRRNNDDRRRSDEKNGHDTYEDNRKNRDDDRRRDRDSDQRQNYQREEEFSRKNREDSGDRRRDKDSDRRNNSDREEASLRSREDTGERRRDRESDRRPNHDHEEEISRNREDSGDRRRDRDSDRRQNSDRDEEATRRNRQYTGEKRRDRESDRRPNDDREEGSRNREYLDGRKRDKDLDRKNTDRDEETTRRNRQDPGDRRRDRESDQRLNDERDEESSRRSREDTVDKRRDREFDRRQNSNRDEEANWRNRENTGETRRDKDLERKQIDEREDTVDKRRDRESDLRKNDETDRSRDYKNRNRDFDRRQHDEQDRGRNEPLNARRERDENDRERRYYDNRKDDEYRKSKTDYEDRRNIKKDYDDERSKHKSYKKKESEDSSSEEESRNKRNKNTKKDDSDEDRSRNKKDSSSKSKQKNKKKDDSSSSSSEDDSSSDDDSVEVKSENRKNSKSKRDAKNKRDDSSSEDEPVSRKRDKNTKKVRPEDTFDLGDVSKETRKDKGRQEKQSQRNDYADKRDERRKDNKDDSYRKRDNEKRKGKETSRDSAKQPEDGWDIRRGSSIQRELGSRYWEK